MKNCWNNKCPKFSETCVHKCELPTTSEIRACKKYEPSGFCKKHCCDKYNQAFIDNCGYHITERVITCKERIEFEENLPEPRLKVKLSDSAKQVMADFVNYSWSDGTSVREKIKKLDKKFEESFAIVNRVCNDNTLALKGFNNSVTQRINELEQDAENTNQNYNHNFNAMTKRFKEIEDKMGYLVKDWRAHRQSELIRHAEEHNGLVVRIKKNESRLKNIEDRYDPKFTTSPPPKPSPVIMKGSAKSGTFINEHQMMYNDARVAAKGLQTATDIAKMVNNRAVEITDDSATKILFKLVREIEDKYGLC